MSDNRAFKYTLLFRSLYICRRTGKEHKRLQKLNVREAKRVLTEVQEAADNEAKLKKKKKEEELEAEVRNCN